MKSKPGKQTSYAAAQFLAKQGQPIKKQLAIFQAHTGYSERWFYMVRAQLGLNNPKQQKIGATREKGRLPK